MQKSEENKRNNQSLPMSCLSNKSIIDVKNNNKKSVKKGFQRSHTKMVNSDLLKAKEQLDNINDNNSEDNESIKDPNDFNKE